MFHDHYWFGMHFFWWIFVIVIIIGTYLFVKLFNKPESLTETPEEILKKKFASGDLTTVEYEERKKILDRDRT